MVMLEEPPRVQQRTGVAAAPLPGRETRSLAFPPWQECLCHAKEVNDEALSSFEMDTGHWTM